MTLRSELTVDEIKAECTTLERAVHSANLATDDEVAGHRPGGEHNPSQEDVYGWLRYYAMLHRFHARGERLPETGAHARNDAMVLDALRDEPIAIVRLQSGEDLFVWPKSLDALLHVHALDLQLAWMLDQQKLLEADASAASIDLLQNVTDVIAYTYNLLCWVVTHPTPGMPYETIDVNPEIPEHIKTLSPWDIVRICQAHQEHLARLGVLSKLIDEKSDRDGGTRPSWSMFVGTMSVELSESTTVLMKHRSLAALLATARLNAAARAVPDKQKDGDDAET